LAAERGGPYQPTETVRLFDCWRISGSARYSAAMSKIPPKPDHPKIEAEIVPFRASQQPAPKSTKMPSSSPENEEPLSDKALIGIGLLIVLLVAAGVWLFDTLRDIGKMQDCAMQGRRNCVQISVPSRDR
jgi:hypothetical protein